MNKGSVDSLKVSVRCGCKPKARQMRPMVENDNPVALARPRVLQCVAASGLLSRVVVMICSTWASVTDRGVPGRGSSLNPSRRSSTKRLRHLPTVGMVTPSCLATWVFGSPLAQARTIRERNARRWAVFGRRAHCSRVDGSSSDKISSFKGRPVRIRVSSCGQGPRFPLKTQLGNELFNEFLIQDTSILSIFDCWVAVLWGRFVTG